MLSEGSEVITFIYPSLSLRRQIENGLPIISNPLQAIMQFI